MIDSGGHAFAGITEVALIGWISEIPVTESLKWLLGGEGRAVILVSVTGVGDIVEQLADQYRGRDWGVVTPLTPAVAEVQGFARTEDGLKKEITVFIAPASVTESRGLYQPVEARCALQTGKVAIVESDETDDRGWKRATYCEGPEGHSAGRQRTACRPLELLFKA